MDLAQLEQIVNWLDEEHRRSRNEIVRLGHLVEAQNADQSNQTKHLQEVEATFARLEGQANRFQQFETVLDTMRQEFLSLHEREEEQRQRMQRDWERARVSEREGVRRDINLLQRELGRLAQLEQSTVLQEDDIKRIGEAVQEIRSQVVSIEGDLEERTQHIPILLDTKSSEQKRLTQLQEDQVAQFQRIEDLTQVVAQQGIELNRLRQETGTVHGLEEKLLRQMEAIQDDFRARNIDIAQRIQPQESALQELATQVERVQTQVNALIPFQASAQKAMAEVKLLRDRIEQSVQQAREAERLFQTKVEKTLKEIQDEAEEQERKDRMKQDHLWQEQERFNTSLQERLLPLQQNLRMHEELLKQLWNLQESYPSQALKAAQDQVENVQNFIMERDQALRVLEEEWVQLRRGLELYANGNGSVAQSAQSMPARTP